MFKADSTVDTKIHDNDHCMIHCDSCLLMESRPQSLLVAWSSRTTSQS
jgi:hypothetical protein